MNKKGFSLIELLAVIVILGVVISIATVSITTVRNKMRQGLVYEKITEGMAAATKYAESNEALSKDLETLAGNSCRVVTFADLINTNNYVAESNDGGTPTVIHDVTKQSLNNLNFCVYKKYHQYFACVPYGEDTDFSIANKELLVKLDDTDIATTYCVGMTATVNSMS